MTDNQQRAAHALAEVEQYVDVRQRQRLLAAALDAAEARGGAEALERAYRAHRTTAAKMTRVEQMTCLIVKVEDLVMDAAEFRAASSSEPQP